MTNTRRLGRLHRRLGRPRPARALLTRAVEPGAAGVAVGRAWAGRRWSLAAVEDRLGDAPAARRWLHRALPYARTFLPFAQDEPGPLPRAWTPRCARSSSRRHGWTTDPASGRQSIALGGRRRWTGTLAPA
nr:hypothetical protein [Angustibacter aerolatus]